MLVARPLKKRRLDSAQSQPDASETDFALSNGSDGQAHTWDHEQDYETRPRKRPNEDKAQRLPIKNVQGLVEQPLEVTRPDSPSSFGSLGEDTPVTDVSDVEEDEPEEVIPRQVQILQAKEELASIASLVNEDPEEHVGLLGTLGKIAASRDPTITRLGLATQLSVYKDLIPGYRIRPLSEEDTKERVSKDVRKQRNFEQSIVRGYHAYVKELSRISHLPKSASHESASLVDVAFSCVCNLLENVPHFNFRNELLTVIVDKLSTRRTDHQSEKCMATLEKLFETDEDGNASLEAVAMLSAALKRKNFNVSEGAINTFLQLRLLSEFSQKASNTRVDRADEQPSESAPKSKINREFRSKKDRKVAKERVKIEKEMQEADAAVGHEERDKNQAETLKLVFGIYFRVLKARTPWLMGAVLEGLVKYAHLINQDFFGDLLEALRELIKDAEIGTSNSEDQQEQSTREERNSDSGRNLTRESLLCVVTAFGLLQGQDVAASASTLGLDLQFFITHLYRTIYSMSIDPDIELGAKTLRAPDPNGPTPPMVSKRKVNMSTTIVLFLRSLQAILLPENARSVPPIRLAAFSKQLLTSSLHMPDKSCTSILGLMNKVAKTHRRKIAALWHTEDRKGDGVFNPLTDEMEGSNPFAATIWDGELLRLHYSPQVREGILALESIVSET